MRAAFWFIAAFGQTITAWKVLPHLWDTDVLSCICVAAALVFMAIKMIENGLNREPLL